MDTVRLFWAIIAGQVVTHLILFIFLSKRYAKEKRQDKAAEETAIQEEQISTLKIQISSLQEELKKSQDNSAIAQNELQNLKKDNLNLNERLRKQEELYAINNTELDRVKKDALGLINKLAGKEQELAKALSQNERLEALEKENKEMDAKLKDFEELMGTLNKEIETQDNTIAEYERKEKERQAAVKEEPVIAVGRTELAREQKKKKIGEILLEAEFITKSVLDKALEYYKNSGGSMTTYLLSNGYINEAQLAQCLCTQFGVPYLPLSAYNIAQEVIQLIPADIAEKYWLVPIEKLGNLLTLVMVDPLDTSAIKEVERITGCKVQSFVGILSEIIESLTKYYKITIKERGLKTERHLPFFIDTETYKGPERRRAVRIRARIDVHFPAEGYYKNSKTRDVSRDGLLFESDIAIPISSLLTLQIDLPRESCPLPIVAIAQVARITQLEDNKFGIGVKIIKISKQELETIFGYASSHEEK